MHVSQNVPAQNPAHRTSWTGELVKFIPYGNSLCLVSMQSKDQLIYCFPEEPMHFPTLP